MVHGPGFVLDRRMAALFPAMAPGTLLMTFAIFLYGLQAIDLLKLSVFWAAHIVMGWVYIAGGIWATPRLFPRLTEKNPFVST